MPEADVFRAIADPTRRAVLELLRGGDRSVSEVMEPFRMSQPAISQQGLSRIDSVVGAGIAGTPRSQTTEALRERLRG